MLRSAAGLYRLDGYKSLLLGSLSALLAEFALLLHDEAPAVRRHVVVRTLQPHRVELAAVLLEHALQLLQAAEDDAVAALGLGYGA